MQFSSDFYFLLALYTCHSGATLFYLLGLIPRTSFADKNCFEDAAVAVLYVPLQIQTVFLTKKKKRIKELKCRGFVITMPHHPTHTVAPAPRLPHPHFTSVSLLFFFYIVFNPKFVSRKPIIPAGEGRVRGKSISGIDHSTKALEVFPELLNSLTTALRTDIKSTVSVIVIFSRTKR